MEGGPVHHELKGRVFNEILRYIGDDPDAADILAMYAARAGKPAKSGFEVLDEFADGVCGLDLDEVTRRR